MFFSNLSAFITHILCPIIILAKTKQSVYKYHLQIHNKDKQISKIMQVNVTKFSRAQTEHKKLLYNLKQTVETLFLNYKTDDSWTNPDGLLRLHTCIEQIFANGIRIYKPDVSVVFFIIFC